MAKYILTKNYSEIVETYGVFQNLSGDANIEITADINEQGILLKPFQKILLNQKVYARKTFGAGTCLLIVLPFKTTDDNTESNSGTSAENQDTSQATNYSQNPYEDFDDKFFYENYKRRQPPPQYFSPPPPPPPPHFMDDAPTNSPSMVENDNFYMLKIPKNSLQGQKKFVIQLADYLKG